MAYSSALMPRTMCLISGMCFFLQSSLGTGGAMVRKFNFRGSGVPAESADLSRLGVPVAWMITSSGTTDTIAFFIRWVCDASPEVWPAVIMSDHDQAQLQALKDVYPLSQIWLCIWHVLRAMRSHFSITVFQLLWEKVKAFVKTEDLAKFYMIWDEISTDPSVPPSFVQYMASSWIPASHIWSKVVWKDHPIYLEGDTNMLIEVYVYQLSQCTNNITDLISSRYHHVLKSHWLDGKRNCHIDYILYTLVVHMNQYYLNRHERQIVGFEGLDLAGGRWWDIIASAQTISRDSVLQFNCTQFHVASQSRPGALYSIDLNLTTCNCQDFPRIRFCKHIAAIHLHFPHLCFEQSDPIMPLEYSLVPDQQDGDPDSDSDSASESGSESESGSASAPEAALPEEILTLTREIISLSQNLATKKINQSHYPAVIEAIRSAKYSLAVADASVEGTSALPDKDFIAPNQKSWSETAACMGVKWPPKQKCLPEERGLTEQAISVTSRRRRTNNDPYGVGQRSGTRAKPDALSADANRHAQGIPPPATTPA